MTALEIILLLTGIICIVLSFVFFDKLDGREVISDVKINAELSEKQKDEIKKQIAQIIGEQVDDISEKTEVSLEKMSNEKIREFGEYSDTVIGEMNKTHDKVMFLYDMLTEKNKEVHSTVRDLSVAKDQLNKAMEQSSAMSANQIKAADSSNDYESVAIRNAENTSETKPAKKTGRRSSKAADNDNSTEETQNKKAVANNRNKEIIKLHNSGLTNLEIAKELNIGTGEVKLVLDLFKGNK